ncbi:hypothetical protein HRbin06_00210 [archaeon HR06]|nr:hypothetical protein HRbin06_00210 [archaeon HR06]
MMLEIPYGSKVIYLDWKVDEVLSPRDFKAEKRKVVKEALRNSSLRAIIGSKRKIGIACDDITRLTPNEEILKALLEEIRSFGVRKEDITLFIALGTHRKMREDEIIKKFGREIVEEYNIVNHEYDKLSELEKVGEFEGFPIWINRSFLRQDVRICIGGIIPHCNAGWGGGGKSLLPGLAGFESVGKFHCYSAFTKPNALGLWKIPVRRLINQFVKKVGLHFILNVVYNRRGEILKAFAGDPIEAHKEGINFSKKVYSVKLKERADITIVSSYPADIEFWQAHKGLASGDLANKEGGGIVFVTPCPEGISVTHKGWGDLLSLDPEDIKSRILRGEVEDYVAAGLALAVAIERSRHKVCLVSDGLTYRDAEKLRFEKFKDIYEALSYLKRIYPEGKVNLLTHGGDTYPRS